MAPKRLSSVTALQLSCGVLQAQRDARLAAGKPGGVQIR